MSASLVRVWRGVQAERCCVRKETMCVCREVLHSKRKEKMCRSKSRWGVCGASVWRGESVKAEREEQKQMVHASVEQRERSESRWCVRAWCELGEQIREVLCILVRV